MGVVDSPRLNRSARGLFRAFMPLPRVSGTNGTKHVGWLAPWSTVAPRACGQAGVQDIGVDPAAVAEAGKPGGEGVRGQAVGAALALEACHEAQADLAVDVAEQPDRAGERALQVRAQLVGQRDGVAPGPFTGPAGGAPT
jgi:hypothetical protein